MKGRCIALLRGVNNIGATTRVTMAGLRALFERIGFRDVRTLLNSGNVVFTVSGKGGVLGRIENALRSELGVTPAVTLLSASDVATIVRDNPLARVATNPSDLLVVVARRPSDLARLDSLAEERWAPEVLALGERVAYLWCANGIANSRLRIAAERAMGPAGTGRNIATLTKALALLEGPLDRTRRTM